MSTTFARKLNMPNKTIKQYSLISVLLQNSLPLRRMELIRTYFPTLTEHQVRQFDQLGNLYAEWNAQINVISRKDIDNLYERHVLHALSIAKIVTFKAQSSVIDLGTGGGFPGIPLAILFPDVEFILIDGTRKKLRVVEAVSEAIKLENVQVKHLRAEDCKDKADFVVSRAVASLDKLLHWARPLLKNQQINALPNGLIALKGGNIQTEIKLLPRHEYTEIYPIQDYFDRPVFDEKYIVYVQG